MTSVSGGPSVYIVTVDTGTGSGTLRLDVLDDDTITDGSGNILGPGDGSFSTGEVYTLDKTNPVVTAVSSTMPTSWANAMTVWQLGENGN